ARYRPSTSRTQPASIQSPPRTVSARWAGRQRSGPPAGFRSGTWRSASPQVLRPQTTRSGKRSSVSPRREECRWKPRSTLPLEVAEARVIGEDLRIEPLVDDAPPKAPLLAQLDRKSTRLNSSHVAISYAVF